MANNPIARRAPRCQVVEVTRQVTRILLATVLTVLSMTMKRPRLFSPCGRLASSQWEVMFAAVCSHFDNHRRPRLLMATTTINIPSWNHTITITTPTLVCCQNIPQVHHYHHYHHYHHLHLRHISHHRPSPLTIARICILFLSLSPKCIHVCVSYFISLSLETNVIFRLSAVYPALTPQRYANPNNIPV